MVEEEEDQEVLQILEIVELGDREEVVLLLR